jgi:coenzyme F420-reducing hydrogenase alpha subunit
MTTNVKVDVHHLTRVEGHGNIVVDVSNGALKTCELQIVETPRFFEAMATGRPYDEVTHVVSRICGICAVGHSSTSVRALEKALGITPTPQTEKLRKLNMHGEILDSHVLHIYMLVAPDLLDLPSVMPLAKNQPEIVLRALRMKKLAGDICKVVSGRHTHPIAMAVGGFTHYPSREDLTWLRGQLEQGRRDYEATVELFQTLTFPSFERETEYIALRKDDEYAFIDGVVASTDGPPRPIEDYRDITNEYIVRHSSAKHTRHRREAYMVGALARFNVNYDKLHLKAQEAARALNIAPIATNPYWNTVAQIVEVVHCIEDAIEITEYYLKHGVKWEELVRPATLSGRGVGAVEVPRGILFHEYEVTDGVVTMANCIIPTGQNLANVEADMRALVPQILDRPQQQIVLALEMLVRAYDPCISCSTHLLDVRFE